MTRQNPNEGKGEIVHNGGWAKHDVYVRPREFALRKGILLTTVPSVLLAVVELLPNYAGYVSPYIWIWFGIYIVAVVTWLALLACEKKVKRSELVTNRENDVSELVS